MNVSDFPNASDLQAFVVAEGIVQAKVITITVRAGRWYLFWWT